MEEDGQGEGRWQVWRWTIAAVVVATLAVALQLTTAPDERLVDQAVAYRAPLQRSAEHYEAGRYQESVDAAKAALEVHPNSADAHNNLALAYLGLRMYDESIQAAQNAVRLEPGHELARNNLAWIEEEKANAARPSVGAAELERARILLNQSLEHARAGRFGECTDSATQAADLNPNLAAAFSNLGFCAANLRQWDEAIRHTQEALRLDPNFSLAIANLAWMEQERLKSRADAVQ